MGGNALKNCTTRRYSRDEYFDLEAQVLSKLKIIFPESQPHAIKAYKSKESFGDMDVLIDSELLPSDWVDSVCYSFYPKEHVKNGNVLSFEYKEFQTDLIVTDPSEMQSSMNYFAYNDLGNLLGRIAHSMGLKLGHNGLSYNWRIDTYQFRNVVLLTDFRDILPVLGYSYERYAQGFDKIEDIFDFVVSSRFFNKDIYLLHNRNNTSRTRDRKRKTYMEFLDWLEGYKENYEQIQITAMRKQEEYDKSLWLPYLFEAIQGFKETYKEVQAEWDLEVLFKTRYNGDLVKQYTGLDGKELGSFMKWMKAEYSAERLKKDICAMNPTLVEGWVKWYKGKFDKES